VSAALLQGVPAMTPGLRAAYDLSLPQVGIVLGAVSFGLMVTLLPWGMAADRFGERVVVPLGLALGGLALYATSLASSYAVLVAGFALAGMGSASANAASGRVVMGWFGADERGLALGIRQASVPAGGALGALVLPIVALEHDVPAALRVLALGMLAGAAIAAVWMRDSPAGGARSASMRATMRWAMRDGPLWRVSVGSSLLVAVQVAFLGFIVLFLHDVHGVSAAGAALWLVGLQVVAAVVRIVLGRVSDRRGQRLGLVLAVAGSSAALLVVLVAVAHAPMVVLAPVLVLASVSAMSWNGLSFAAIAELAPAGSTGAALGFQNTMLALTTAVWLPVFAVLVDVTSWRASFACIVLLPLAALVVLRGPARAERDLRAGT
jgi:sugar phosphate permease